jgi:hypothetical protein
VRRNRKSARRLQTKPEGKQRCNLFYSREIDWFHVWKERTEKY